MTEHWNDAMREVEVWKELEKWIRTQRRFHYSCDDTWYACPKSEDGCADSRQGDECNCGADEFNQELDRHITALDAIRSQP